MDEREGERDENFSIEIGRERDHWEYLGIVWVVMVNDLEHVGCDFVGKF